MPHRRYKLDVFARGVRATTGTITHTFSSSEIRDAPAALGGTVLRLDSMTVESEPWTVTVVDKNSTMTGLLADGNGRMHLLGRLVRVRQSLDSTASTAYTTVAVGRLTDVALTDDVASYALTVSDERWLEREADIFTTVGDSCWLLPGGPKDGLAGNGVEAGGSQETIQIALGRDPVQPGRWRVAAKGGSGDSANVQLEWADTRPWPTTDNGRQHETALYTWLGADLDNVAGRYRTAVWQQNGTTARYPLWKFGAPAGGVGKLKVLWSTATHPAVGTILYGYLYAPEAVPSKELPRLIGGVGGVHPFTLLQNIYQGTYSASTSFLPRISTAAFNTLVATTNYGVTWWRITAPTKMATFADTYLYPGYGVVPVIDSSGQVAPVALLPPTTVQITASQTITSTNAQTPPTFSHPGREVRTVLQYKVLGISRSNNGGVDMLEGGEGSTSPDLFMVAAGNEWSRSFTHDNTSMLGRREAVRHLGMANMRNWELTGNFPLAIPTPFSFLETLAHQQLRLLGDGPVYATVRTSSALTVRPGQWVRLKVGVYPNRDTGTRTTAFSRICLVTERHETPVGRQYTLLDYGASTDTPLATPTVSLALISGSSRHGIRASLGNLATGAWWRLEYGAGATTSSTAPIGYREFATGTTATTSYDGTIFPSKTKFFGRVRQSKGGRVDSLYSAAASVVTAAISPPTGLGVSGVGRTVATLKWTNGSTAYATQVLFSVTSGTTLTADDVLTSVSAGSTVLQIKYLDANNGYKVGVRHIDAFGGGSAQDTTTFTTTTGAQTAPALKGFAVVYGLGAT